MSWLRRLVLFLSPPPEPAVAWEFPVSYIDIPTVLRRGDPGLARPRTSRLTGAMLTRFHRGELVWR